MPASLKSPWFERKAFRPLIKRLPKSPRCDICYMPFEGIGGWFSKVFWMSALKAKSTLCNLCERYAENITAAWNLKSPSCLWMCAARPPWQRIFPRKNIALRSIVSTAQRQRSFTNNGFVEKLLGDEVAGFFVPGFAGPKHAKAAYARKKNLKAMGYGGSSEPWIPVGVGINTGVAYVGSVNADNGISDISMLECGQHCRASHFPGWGGRNTYQ